MREEYDFSKGEHGKFYGLNATMNLPVYLDAEVLDYFAAKAKAKSVELNRMVNDLRNKDIALIEEVKYRDSLTAKSPAGRHRLGFCEQINQAYSHHLWAYLFQIRAAPH